VLGPDRLANVATARIARIEIVNAPCVGFRHRADEFTKEKSGS